MIRQRLAAATTPRLVPVLGRQERAVRSLRSARSLAVGKTAVRASRPDDRHAALRLVGRQIRTEASGHSSFTRDVAIRRVPRGIRNHSHHHMLPCSPIFHARNRLRDISSEHCKFNDENNLWMFEVGGRREEWSVFRSTEQLRLTLACAPQADGTRVLVGGVGRGSPENSQVRMSNAAETATAATKPIQTQRTNWLSACSRPPCGSTQQAGALAGGVAGSRSMPR